MKTVCYDPFYDSVRKSCELASSLEAAILTRFPLFREFRFVVDLGEPHLVRLTTIRGKCIAHIDGDIFPLVISICQEVVPRAERIEIYKPFSNEWVPIWRKPIEDPIDQPKWELSPEQKRVLAAFSH